MDVSAKNEALVALNSKTAGNVVTPTDPSAAAEWASLTVHGASA